MQANKNAGQAARAVQVLLPKADKLSIRMIALLDQRERQLISERTKAGLAVAGRKNA